MKPKIALAKYLDWAVLAVLAAALALVAVRSFVLKATGEEKLREELSQYESTVQRGMADTSAPAQTPRDYLGELKDRFEHPAVIDPYRHNPFLTREDIPYPPLQLKVGKPRELKFKGTRLTQVITPDEGRVRVDLAYDLATGVSIVTFTPLVEGETIIRIQTDEDLVHLFRISAQIVPMLRPPNPPINVRVEARAAVEVRKTAQPAMVLITFMPDDPREASRTVGYSNAAEIYRKPAGASDSEYVRLAGGPRQPLVPLSSREQIHEIMLKFQLPEVSAGPAGPAAPAGPGPAVPEAVTEIRPPSLAGTVAGGEPPQGSFVFLDQGVDGGESYIYKIVTLSTAPDLEPVACKEPYVSPEPVFVPALVEFIVRAITSDRATVRVYRRDPDSGELLTRDFPVGVGMKIGEMVSLRLPLVPGMPPRTKDVDFSTGCILVNVLPTFQGVEYGKLRSQRVGYVYVPVYQTRYVRDPRILYLTPRGSLLFKSKEK